MKLIVFVLDGVFDTGLSVLLDAFSTANELATAQTLAPPLFEVKLVGVRQHIRTGQGFTIEVESAGTAHRPDWVIVPALNAKRPESLIEALARPDVRDAMRHLQTWHADGVGIAAACVGTFLLAEAGLLDQGEATTTWSLAPFFRQRYPTVKLDDSRMIVASQRIVTAGAAMGIWTLRFGC